MLKSVRHALPLVPAHEPEVEVGAELGGGVPGSSRRRPPDPAVVAGSRHSIAVPDHGSAEAGSAGFHRRQSGG